MAGVGGLAPVACWLTLCRGRACKPMLCVALACAAAGYTAHAGGVARLMALPAHVTAARHAAGSCETGQARHVSPALLPDLPCVFSCTHTFNSAHQYTLLTFPALAPILPPQMRSWTPSCLGRLRATRWCHPRRATRPSARRPARPWPPPRPSVAWPRRCTRWVSWLGPLRLWV